MGCHELSNLLKAEKIDLEEEIIKHKYYLSEKAGRDVGFKTAERHFLENYLNSWATGFKRCYCHLVCKDEQCPNYKKEVYKSGEENSTG